MTVFTNDSDYPAWLLFYRTFAHQQSRLLMEEVILLFNCIKSGQGV